MKSLNRKAGLLQNNAVRVILMLVILFAIYLPFHSKIFGEIEAESLSDICRASAYELHIIRKANPKATSLFDCPVRDIIIRDKVNARNDIKIKNTIAKAMEGCWDQLGKGEWNLFKGYGTHCVYCHNINFSDTGGKIHDFDTYLSASYPDVYKVSEFDVTTLDTSQTYSIIYVYFHDYVEAEDEIKEFTRIHLKQNTPYYMRRLNCTHYPAEQHTR